MTASGLDRTHLISFLNASLRQSPWIPTRGPVHVRLMEASGDAATLGTELPPGGAPGYSPGAGAPVIPFSVSATFGVIAPTTGAIANSMTVSLPGMQAATTHGVELWDEAPSRKWWGELIDPVTTNEGDTLSFPAGSVVPQIEVE